MANKTEHKRLNRNGYGCTIAGLVCDYIGFQDYVKERKNLSYLVTVLGLGFNVASFVYYLRSLNALDGNGDEDDAFIDHLMGSVVGPMISAVHLSKSLGKN